MQQTLTAKIQVIVSDTDKLLLDVTMDAYHNACNFVSGYVFRTHDLKQFSLNKILYTPFSFEIADALDKDICNIECLVPDTATME